MKLSVILLSAAAVVTGAAMAADETGTTPALGTSQDVLARQGPAVLTQAEIDATFSEIPEQHRLAFVRNGDRVNQAIGALLRAKLLAEAARAAGFDQDPLIQGRMALAAERELSSIWLQEVIKNAPEADYEALANEYYLANPEKFQSVRSVDVTHLLISKEKHSVTEALELAEDIAEMVAEDPSRFNELVLEYSEDPTAPANGGRFPEVQVGQMVKEFEDAAFGMKREGQIVGPIETAYGFHIIRLNAINAPQTVPFEQAKRVAMEEARTAYLQEYRMRYMQKLQSEPIRFEEGALDAMARRYFGENLENMPDYREQQVQE